MDGNSHERLFLGDFFATLNYISMKIIVWQQGSIPNVFNDTECSRQIFELLPHYLRRVMREVYQKRLQENVLRGKVSMVHHRNVVEM
jgi:hypothetical protein